MRWKEGQEHQLNKKAQVARKQQIGTKTQLKRTCFNEIIPLKRSTYDNTRFMIMLVYWK